MSEATPLRPGDEVDSWCTKCREMRLHNVKAVPPDRAVRVICRTCDGEHNLRPQPPKSKRAKKVVVEHNPWEELTANVREDRIMAYTISGSFGEGDFLQHKKYGLGVVTEILDANKMSVAFQDKKRIMVCNK